MPRPGGIGRREVQLADPQDGGSREVEVGKCSSVSPDQDWQNVHIEKTALFRFGLLQQVQQGCRTVNQSLDVAE